MPDAKHATNYIDSSAVLCGVLKSLNEIEIHGSVEGRISSESRVVVSHDGAVQGEIKTKDAYIKGCVEGVIEASGRIIAASGSRLSCNIAAARMSTEPGAEIHGELIITPNWREEIMQRGDFTNRSKRQPAASSSQAEPPSASPSLPTQAVTVSANFPTARKVKLFGSFNQWDKSKAYKLRRTQSGRWTAQLRLAPGTYEYLFLVNGKEEIDPDNPKKIVNAYGGVNSVLVVEPNESTDSQPAESKVGE